MWNGDVRRWLVQIEISEFRWPRPPTVIALSILILELCTIGHSIALNEYYSGENPRLCYICTCKDIGESVEWWCPKVVGPDWYFRISVPRTTNSCSSINLNARILYHSSFRSAWWVLFGKKSTLAQYLWLHRYGSKYGMVMSEGGQSGLKFPNSGRWDHQRS